MNEWGEEEARQLAHATNRPGDVFLRMNAWNVDEVMWEDYKDGRRRRRRRERRSVEEQRHELKQKLADEEGKNISSLSFSFLRLYVHHPFTNPSIHA